MACCAWRGAPGCAAPQRPSLITPAFSPSPDLQARILYHRRRNTSAGYVGVLPRPFQPVYGIGQDIGGEIDLGGRRETSEADANRRIRERVGETHRTQHIGGFYDRRGAGGSG